MNPKKIVLLPDVDPTPSLLIAELAEHTEDIEAVAVVFLTKGGEVEAAWSGMQKLQLVGLSTMLQDAAVRLFMEDGLPKEDEG